MILELLINKQYQVQLMGKARLIKPAKGKPSSLPAKQD